MAQKFVYITDQEFLNRGAMHNPVTINYNLEEYYPEFYSINFDLKLSVDKEATKAEKECLIYNDYRERYGSFDVHTLEVAIPEKGCKNVLLYGFDTAHFHYIAPYIKDTTEILYLFKCPRIKDLSPLSEFRNLKAIFVYWNTALEELWNMGENRELKIVDFKTFSKLKNIEGLEKSFVEYICLDSSSILGKPKEMKFDRSVLDRMKNLKHMCLVFKEEKTNF